jgi:C-terminal binding protein
MDAARSLPEFVSLDATDVEFESRLLVGLCDVSCLSLKTQEQALAAPEVETAEFIAVWHTIWLTPELLQRFKACRMVVRMGVGYDNINTRAAGELGIPVCNVPNYGTEEVADSAMAHILSLFRQTLPLAIRVAAGDIIHGPDDIAAAAGSSCVRVRGRVLGIVGLGRIGTATAVRAKVFGFGVLFFDPWVVDGQDKAIGVERCESLAELLAASDVISLHCNCTEENTRMIDADALKSVKRGSFFVNTARGELVDDEALLCALEDGILAGACLDVHWGEPFVLGKSAPLGTRGAVLVKSGKLICTPHNAWYSVESRRELRTLDVDAVKHCLAGTPLRNVVNKMYLINSRSPVL